jgi:hypothetical protein
VCGIMTVVHRGRVARKGRRGQAELVHPLNEGRITCAVGGRGCGPCTHSEKT